jgi:hypothetical protein
MLLITEKASNLIANSLNQHRMFTFLSLKIKYRFLLLICLLANLTGVAQKNSDKKNRVPTGYSKTVSAGINVTILEFSRTHSFGAGIGFSWTKHRFGMMEKKPSKPFGFIADAGIDYYLGKEETVSGYPYKYNGFTYIHTYGGIIYNCCKRGNINLTAGPALGLESGFTTFFWGINLSGAYYINEKIAITPGIHFMKDFDSYDPLKQASLFSNKKALR